MKLTTCKASFVYKREVMSLDARLVDNKMITDKEVPIRTFLHYSDRDRNREICVFGEARDGLFYNYDDRLPHPKWQEGLNVATTQAVKNSARYFEIALSHIHDKSCNVEHILLGCNKSSGFSYLVFGYTY